MVAPATILDLLGCVADVRDSKRRIFDLEATTFI
jgi:hypothetical protein